MSFPFVIIQSTRFSSCKFQPTTLKEQTTVSLNVIPSVFLKLALKKNGESTSSLPNTSASSIPEGQTLLLCSFQAAMLVSFALELWEMKTICCTICCCAVPSVWTWRLCLFSISWGKNVVQNKLIPNTSCLWRQEDVTVTILRL